MKKGSKKPKPTPGLFQAPIEYTGPSGEPWKLTEPNAITAEIGVKPDEIAAFHAFMWSDEAMWKLVRMRYGILPVLPQLGADPDMMRSFALAEIASMLGHESTAALEGKLQVVAANWARERDKKAAPELPVVVVEKIETRPVGAGAMTDSQRALLKELGFSTRIFELEGRSEEEKEAEMAWFGARIEELSKMLREPMARALGKQAVINEMLINRYDAEILTTPVHKEKHAFLQEAKQQVERVYKDQWAQIEEICPYIKSAAGRVKFSETVSDFIDAVREWKANANNKPMDGLFTQYEIQVLMRQSQQLPMKYRPGLVVAINDAKQGIYDPKWRQTIPNSILKRIDQGWLEAQEKLNEDPQYGKLIDLASDHPSAEYPDLVDAAPSLDDEEIRPPSENVSLE